jgi:hypothetical protein
MREGGRSGYRARGGGAGAECGRAGWRVPGEGGAGGAGGAVAAAAAAAVGVVEGGAEEVWIWLRSEAGRRRRGECGCEWDRGAGEVVGEREGSERGRS